MSMEGFSSSWYQDGKCKAIGYGHNNCTQIFERITKAGAKKLLKRDIEKALIKTKRLYRINGYTNYDTLPDNRKYALVELVFSTGGFRKFPKYTKALVDGDMIEARRQVTRYYKRGGKIIELETRNRAISKIFLK